MKIRKWIQAGVTVSLLAVICGCDWSTSGDDDSWSDRYNWVNFSGVYRGAGGGALVSTYSTTPASSTSVFTVTGERIATGNGSKTVFNGTVKSGNLVAGSFSVSTAGYQLNETGGGALSGNAGSSGSIVSGTGAWSVDFGGTAPDNGAPIYASYQYTAKTDTGTGGSSGKTIYSFVVTQEGNKLSFVDNNGAVYSGNFGSVRTTQGASRDTPSDSGTPAVGDTVIGSFEVNGTSAAGYPVTITGTFQGTVGANLQLTGRVLNGTWIEKGGKTGNVSGQAS